MALRSLHAGPCACSHATASRPASSAVCCAAVATTCSSTAHLAPPSTHAKHHQRRCAQAGIIACANAPARSTQPGPSLNPSSGPGSTPLPPPPPTYTYTPAVKHAFIHYGACTSVAQHGRPHHQPPNGDGAVGVDAHARLRAGQLVVLGSSQPQRSIWQSYDGSLRRGGGGNAGEVGGGRGGGLWRRARRWNGCMSSSQSKSGLVGGRLRWRHRLMPAWSA